MQTIFLNLGSNRGNRKQNIGRTIELIADRWPVAALRRSPWVYSEAWGYNSSETFTNVGLALDFPDGGLPDPFAVLRSLQEIERRIAPEQTHRKPDGTYSDRMIDIDIIAFGNQAINTPELTVPHPRAAARDFVMKPMQFLCPGWNPDTAVASQKKTISDMHRDDLATFRAKPKMPVVVVLDNIRSLNNIGSIFRTSDGFAVSEILLCGICATPPASEIHKTALGAEQSVAWSYWKTTAEAVAHLKEQGYTLCCLEQVNGSVSLEKFEPSRSEKYAIIAGNEVSGVEPAIVAAADVCLEIPQAGTKHSLNVAVSTAIALWHFFPALRP